VRAAFAGGRLLNRSATVGQEYRDAKAREQAKNAAEKAWDVRAGLVAKRKEFDRAIEAERRSAERLSRTKASAIFAMVAPRPKRLLRTRSRICAVSISKATCALAECLSEAGAAPCLVRAAVEGRLPQGIGVERLRDALAEWSRQFEALGLNLCGVKCDVTCRPILARFIASPRK
jgi:hypothetical protein